MNIHSKIKAILLAAITSTLTLGVSAANAAGPAGIDGQHKRDGQQAIDLAIEYISSRQNMKTLGWDDDPDALVLPAITGLIVDGLMLDPRIDQSHPLVTQGMRYILKYTHDDGSIHGGSLPSYNTSICLSALAKVNNKQALDAVIKGQAFLKSLQYSNINDNNPNDPGFDEPITINHPFYGGVGYGDHGRPDLSNLSFFLQALHDTGVSAEDPAFQRAQIFLSRVQMLDSVNEMHYADGSNQGGFIYATVPDLESVDGRAGQSQAGSITETTSDGQELTRLRAYGSMTYAGFKSLIYANLDPDDPSLAGAWKWIEANYTLEQNPGLDQQGYYYYLATMARALDAYGVQEINGHNWREEMIDKIISLQWENGAFKVLNKRWMEDNDILISAYALIALQHATH